MAISAETNLVFYLCGLIPKGSAIDFHISSISRLFEQQKHLLPFESIKQLIAAEKSSSGRTLADEGEMEVKEGKREIVKNGGVVIQEGEGRDSGG